MAHYDQKGSVHRPLAYHAKDPMRGDDIKALQREVNQRLREKGETHYLLGTPDGVLGPKTSSSSSRALFVLGVSGKRLERSQVGHGGLLSEDTQRLLRNPGKYQTKDMRARSSKRMAEIRKDRAKAAAKRKAQAHSREHVIALATQAAKLALAHAPSVHYTQGASRWQGISSGLIAADGHYPNWADCSSFYTWCMWQGLRGGPDIVNGQNWGWGWTGTLYTHGERIDHDEQGAAALYGPEPGEHVAYCLGNGYVISHGSEAGPFLLPLHYRSDLSEIRRYV